jgi:hypothetical protein
MAAWAIAVSIGVAERRHDLEAETGDAALGVDFEQSAVQRLDRLGRLRRQDVKDVGVGQGLGGDVGEIGMG